MPQKQVAVIDFFTEKLFVRLSGSLLARFFLELFIIKCKNFLKDFKEQAISNANNEEIAAIFIENSIELMKVNKIHD